MILKTSKSIVWFKMETIEIPYKHIQLIRVNQIKTKIGTTENLQIKYIDQNEVIGFPALDDMDRFEQEMKNRWINIYHDMDEDEFQRKLSCLKELDTDIKKQKKEAYIKDISNQFDWIKFWCWMWFMSILFFIIVFILFVLIYSTIKKWFLNLDTALVWFSSPTILIISIFAYIFYCRKTSYIKIYPNSIVVKKHTHSWKATYEIYPWEVEYANIETMLFTYSVYLKIKNQEEKILVSHIKDWDKLKDCFNSIWIITSERNQGIFNHKLWYNTWSIDKYLQFNDITSGWYKNWNKYYCNRSYSDEKPIWFLLFVCLFGWLLIGVTILNHNKSIYFIALYPVCFLLYFIGLSAKWQKSFVELDEKNIKICRAKWIIIKIKEDVVDYDNIKNVVVTKKWRHPWYNVVLYLKNWDWCKSDHIYFNVDDWKQFKNELKWRWIDVKFNSYGR